MALAALDRRVSPLPRNSSLSCRKVALYWSGMSSRIEPGAHVLSAMAKSIVYGSLVKSYCVFRGAAVGLSVRGCVSFLMVVRNALKGVLAEFEVSSILHKCPNQWSLVSWM